MARAFLRDAQYVWVDTTVSVRRLFFVCGQPPTAWIPQIGSGWCFARPRRSRRVGQFVLFPVLVVSWRSVVTWPLPRHVRIQ